MANISKINVNNTTYDLKDGRYPDIPDDGSQVLMGDGTWGTISSGPWVSGDGTNSAVLDPGNGNTAGGAGAYSSGYYAAASSDRSHAEGYFAAASGTYSHAEGYDIKASGNYSHAEGANVQAKGTYSHAEGMQTTAIGAQSHTEGRNTIAIGNNSHAEGGYTSTSSITLTGSGTTYTTRTVLYNYFKGYVIQYGSVTTYITSVDIANQTITVAESLGTLSSTSVTLSSRVAAFGVGSHAEGANTVANADYSHAEGSGAITNGNYSHAEGASTVAGGVSSHAEGYMTNTSGSQSHAEGYQTTSTGQYSHAEGSETNSLTKGSHAEGQYSTSNGNYSHAEGLRTISYGTNSHAEGRAVSRSLTLTGSGTSYTIGGSTEYMYGSLIRAYTLYTGTNVYITNYDESTRTITTSATLGDLSSVSVSIYSNNAYGAYSHSEGEDTRAVGSSSHAEGDRTAAVGAKSHSEGCGSLAYSAQSHAEGYYTQARNTGSHAEGDHCVTYGAYSHAEGGASTQSNLIISGSGTSYTYSSSSVTYFTLYGVGLRYGNARAYITAVDTANNTITTDISLGTLSSASIYYCSQPLTIGGYSHAEGNASVARGQSSHAEGNGRSFGIASHAEGNDAVSYGLYSHAEGRAVIAYGGESHAEGLGSTLPFTLTLTGSSKTYTYTQSRSETDLLGAVIECGGQVACIVSCDTSTKTITLDKNLGSLSSATGYAFSGVSTGANSHSEGQICNALGAYSHAEGYKNIAVGTHSHVEGQQTIAVGNYSHAEGQLTKTTANFSHAEGYGTLASSMFQHVAGKYNVEDASDVYVEIIGIGTLASSRKNGRTLDWSGNEQLAGSLTLGLGTTNETTITAAQLKQLLTLI